MWHEWFFGAVLRCSGLLAWFAMLPWGLLQNAAAAENAASVLVPCTLEGVRRAAQCGVIDVAENPQRPRGRRVALHVVVIPANGGGPVLPDPIALLMGGPGEDAISVAADFIDMLEPLLRDRDLLLVDQRGTGRSGALRCKLYSAEDPAISLRELFPVDAVQQCARQLSGRADLTQYGYARFADDLELVRRTLRYEALNLFAGSYGTRAAQVYVRAHPRSVRTVYFGSVVPLDAAIPLSNAVSTDGVLERTFDACAAEPACHAAFPQLRAEFRQLLARLDSGSVRVTIPGSVEAAPLHRGRVVEWFRSQLYRPATAAELPWLIHHAFLGEWTAIANGILDSARGLDSAFSVGLLFSITCNEDLAFVREQDIQRETQGTSLGDYRVRQQRAACQQWPKVAVPPAYRQSVRSAVPALFVSGDSDVATPLWFTERVAAGFTNRIELLHAGRGHTEWSECTLQQYQRFVTAREIRGIEKVVCAPAQRPAFRTD